MQIFHMYNPNMDGMEIMMEIMGFRRFRLKTKQEGKFYSSLLGYNNSRKIGSLISLTDLADSQLTVLHSRSSFVWCDSRALRSF